MSAHEITRPMTVPDQNAFPENIYHDQRPIGQSPGLTKREFFAALAMNAYVSSEEGLIVTLADMREAVRIADNLIAALNHDEF